jgi:hypothetical protein
MRALLLCSLFLVSGCKRFQVTTAVIDEYGFAKLGYTPFSHPEEITLKEIHLDTGGLKGREVVIEGRLLELGNFSTFAILGDESARMLVILTKVLSAKELISQQGKAVTLRILGTVSGGQMGLPFIDARAVNVVASSASGA